MRLSSAAEIGEIMTDNVEAKEAQSASDILLTDEERIRVSKKLKSRKKRNEYLSDLSIAGLEILAGDLCRNSNQFGY